MRLLSRNIIVQVLVATSILAGTLTSALATNGVANTKHNFAIGGTPGFSAAAGSGVTEVCVFCHTPHFSVKTGPLWNKANTTAATSFRLYTSSNTLTDVVRNSSLTGIPNYDSPSLLCLGCHDGKTAMNILHNSSYGVAPTTDPLVNVGDYPAGSTMIPVSNGGFIAYAMPTPYPDILNPPYDTPEMRTGGGTGIGSAGDDLTNDHPIGFSYSAAWTEKEAGVGGLHSPAVAKAGGVRFFGATDRMECSTCHNPHVDATDNMYLKPFLVKSNQNSELCLTCHDK